MSLSVPVSRTESLRGGQTLAPGTVLTCALSALTQGGTSVDLCLAQREEQMLLEITQCRGSRSLQKASESFCGSWLLPLTWPQVVLEANFLMGRRAPVPSLRNDLLLHSQPPAQGVCGLSSGESERARPG